MSSLAKSSQGFPAHNPSKTSPPAAVKRRSTPLHDSKGEKRLKVLNDFEVSSKFPKNRHFLPLHTEPEGFALDQSFTSAFLSKFSYVVDDSLSHTIFPVLPSALTKGDVVAWKSQ